MEVGELGRLRLAYVTVRMPTPSEEFLAVEINGLRALGTHVQVFTLRRPWPEHERLSREQSLEQISIHYVPTMGLAVLADMLFWLVRRPLSLARFTALLFSACWSRPEVLLRSLAIVPKSLRIARLVEREGIPLVHTAWSHYPAVTALLIKALVPNVRLTMALGAYDRLLHHPLTACAANEADWILTQSQTLQDVIRQEFPDIKAPIRTIFRGVDFSALDFHFRSDRTPGLVVSVGRLIPEKGHQFLIRAMARVVQHIPHARLRIYGAGYYGKELQELVRELGIENAVSFASHLPQQEMFAEIAGAEVFVLSSISENMPNSLKEAMALGIPVITTPTTGIEELVIDGETGFIVAPDDLEGLVRRIEMLLEDGVLASRLRAAGRAHVKAIADLEQTSSARFQLYTSLLAGNSS